MLLVFFARMVDDLVADVVASAADRGKALIGQSQPEPPQARFELVPSRPDVPAHWAPGSWEWDGQSWAWHGGHWEESRASRHSHKRTERAQGIPSSRRPNVAMIAAHGAAR